MIELICDILLGRNKVAVIYRKLWKLLIDRNMKKKDLRLATGISTNAVAKLGKNERVSTDVIEKICLSLNCDVGDIMEVREDAIPPYAERVRDKLQTLSLPLDHTAWGSHDYRNMLGNLITQAQSALEGFMPVSSSKFKDNPIQVIDFFCGAGGTSLGFATLNDIVPAFALLGGCDLDAVSATTYSHNFGTELINADIAELAVNTDKLNSILEKIGYDASKPTIMIGCAPCQGFSSHRKRHWDEGDDVRNSLVMSFARIVSKIRPDVVIMENVPEFLSKRYWRYFSAAKKSYQVDGYTVKGTIYNAASFGVPQERFRSIIIAMKKDFALPSGFLNPGQYKTVRDAIGTLPVVSAGVAAPDDPLHKSASHKQSTLDVIRKVPHDGGNRPVGVGPACLDRVSGFSDVYGRLFWDKPAITITHYARNPASGRYTHPEQDRGLTAREAALLQSFPLGFKFTGKSDDVYRQIGEAVPPMLSTAIAASILIELISCQPSKQELKESPMSIEEPVSNSYSSVIAGIKNKVGKANC